MIIYILMAAFMLLLLGMDVSLMGFTSDTIAIGMYYAVLGASMLSWGFDE